VLIRLVVLAGVSAVAAALEDRGLRRWPSQPRGQGFYMLALAVGNIAVGLVALFLALAVAGELWAMVISAPILTVPFLRWVLAGLLPRAGARSR
jgi:ABC-type spermidine/putrescine transport system permease subunit II